MGYAVNSPPDPFTTAEYAIGFESLRFVIQHEVARAGSAAALARTLGIDARPFRRFLAGADPAPELWRVLTDLARETEGEKALPPVGNLGFAVVVSTLPVHLRAEARLRMAQVLAALYAEQGERPPAWLDLETRRRREMR
jgi:hypothetical protein